MVHQRKSLWIMLLILITLTACAAKKPPVNNTAAGKQVTGPKSYSEVWLDKKTLQVDFKGNIEEKVDKIKAMAVLRAAGIGKEKNMSALSSSTQRIRPLSTASSVPAINFFPSKKRRFQLRSSS